MTKHIPLGLALTLSTIACVDMDSPELSSTDSEIINGSAVDPEDSGIPMLGNGCSSVLLSNSWLLTAGHCVDSFIDRKFSADGHATALFHEGTGVARAIALDAYGQAVVGGVVDGRFAIAKLRKNGTLDPYFNGGSGRVVIDFASSTSEELSDVAIDSSGRIVAVGTAIVAGRTQVAIARFTSSGVLDTSFDGDGKVLTEIPTLDFVRGHAVAIDNYNRIVVGVRMSYNNDVRYAVFRYRTDGQVDGTWHYDGSANTEISVTTDDYLEDIAIDPWGRVLVAGTSNGKMGLARFTSNGAIDTSFSGDGEVWQSYGTTGTTSIYGLAVDASGRPVVVGKSTASDGLLVGRFTASGVPDTTFSSDGWVTYSPRWRFNEASASKVTIDDKGRIVVVGSTIDGNGASAALVARFHPSGAPDLSFGGDGSIDEYARDDQGTLYEAFGKDIAIDSDGNMFVAHTAGFVTSSGSAAYRIGAMHLVGDHLAVPAWPALTVTMGSQQVGSAFVYTHPSLDVALVKLAAPMVLNGRTTGYAFHGFDTSTPSSFVGDEMECYGYGKNTYDDGLGTLRHATLSVDSATYNEYRLVPNQYGQITFSGDSGGPCYSTTNGAWRVSGVTSWGTSSPSSKTVLDTNNVAAGRFAAWVEQTRTTYGP